MSIMSISLNSASSDTASLTSRLTFHNNTKNWSAIFDERIYQLCNLVHPGLPIELDAVEHIRSLLQGILAEICEQRCTSVVDVDKVAQRLFGPGLQSVTKDAWDNMQSQMQRGPKFQKSMKNVLENQHKIASHLKEYYSSKEKEKREKEKRELERMSCYIYYACESITEDILRLTGNYVKNIRNGEQKITFSNLDVALNADRALMELRTKLKNEEEAESPGGFGFLSKFDDYVTEEAERGQKFSSSTKQTYESIATEFLRDERCFIREINRINVFRRRLESLLLDEDRCHLGNLFGNINEIHELAMKMERTLEDAIELNDTQCIGMGIWDLAETCEFDTYTSYIIRDSDNGERKPLTVVINETIEIILNSPKFAKLFQDEDHVFNSSLDGQSFRLALQYVLPYLLHIPLFHIFQYLEYIGMLYRLSDNDDDRTDLKNCQSSLMSVRNSVESMCSEYSEMKSMISSFLDELQKSEKIYIVRRMHEIQSSIDGFMGSPIGKTCNDFEKEGELCMNRPSLSFPPDSTKNKKWKTERYVYIFDQLIVLCKKHRNSLKFKDRLPVHSVDVYDVPDTESIRFCFRLCSRDSSCLPKSYYFVCKSHAEKKEWMTILVKVTTKSILDRILDNYEKEEAKRIPLIIPGPEQYIFAEPDSDENISFEDYTSSSGIPVIRNGTVIKLVERLTYHSYTDSKYIQTFLISYRSFCTPNDLFKLLIERFNIPIPNKLLPQNSRGGGPLAGRYDTVQSHGLSPNNCYSPNFEQSFQRFRKEYEHPVQLKVLSVINQWVKFHWYDFQCDTPLLEQLSTFLQKCCEPKEKLTKQHKKFCKTILATIDKRIKNPPAFMHSEGPEKTDGEEGHVNSAFVYGEEGQPSAYANDQNNGDSFSAKRPATVWHTAQKGDIDNYDLLTLHPLEIGRQLTLLHFDLYRAIKPIELVEAAWTKHDKYRKSPQLLRLTDHSTLLTYWVSRSIVETESLEERLAMFNRALEVMSVFEELHNFTGLVAFLAALNSSCVYRLSWCWDRLDNEKQKCYARFTNLCEPRWQEMHKRLQTINPPCVPFFGRYLSNIYFFEQGNSTFVKSPANKHKDNQQKTSDMNEETISKRALVSFFKCRRISDLIREIQMYQNEPYSLTLEPSIRQFFESINPKCDFKNQEELESYLYQKSIEIQPKNVDPPVNDAKPKHNLATLRSPGIKPPKHSNHYSMNHPINSHFGNHQSVPSTPSAVHDSKRSNTHSHEDEKKGFSTASNSKPTILQPPPPLLSRSNRHKPRPTLSSLPPTTLAPMVPAATPKQLAGSPKSNSTTPGSAVDTAPKLYPRKMATPPLTKSPLTPSKDNGQSAFQFPNVYDIAPPLPPRPSTSSDSSSPSTSAKENQEQLPILFDREDPHSPTVKLSVPLPPALPPPRGSNLYRQPPPLPPKTGRANSSSPTNVPRDSGNQASSSIPPPLPPKTYRARKHE